MYSHNKVNNTLKAKLKSLIVYFQILNLTKYSVYTMHAQNEKDAMTSRCLDRKEVRCATWQVHNGTDQLVRALCTHIR